MPPFCAPMGLTDTSSPTEVDIFFFVVNFKLWFVHGSLAQLQPPLLGRRQADAPVWECNGEGVAARWTP